MNVYEKLAHPIALAVFIVTLFLPVIIGFIALRRTRSQSDFFVGGWAVKRLVVALSAVSSGRSSWLVLGVSGLAYSRGLGAVWAVLGYTVVEFFQFIYIGRKLRAQARELDSITLLDYFETRFNDTAHLIRVAGAAIIGIFTTAYVSAQLFGGAKTLSGALNLDLGICLVISAVLILIYMVLGGYVAVVYNDVVRAVIMLVGLVVLPLAGFVKIGGLSVVRDELLRLDPAFIDPLSIGVGSLIGYVGIGLGSPGQPHILVRYMSIDDPKNLKYAAVIGTVWNVLLGAGAVAIGLVGRAVVSDVGSLPNGDPEMIYLFLSNEYFGPALYGLLVGGVFAAILSTADSQLLVVASTFVRDIYEKVLRKRSDIEESRKLRLSRYVVIASGVAALVLAYLAEDLVFWLVLFAWGGLGASLGPAVILSLYWSRTSRYGVLSGMIVGTLVTIVWRLWLQDSTGLYHLIPAFICSTAVTVAVSLLSRGPADRDSGVQV